MAEKRIDHMHYLPDMDILDSDMLEQVLTHHAAFRDEDYDSADVTAALANPHLEPRDFMAL